MEQHKMSKWAGLLGIMLAGGTVGVVMPVITPAQAQHYQAGDNDSASIRLNGHLLATSVPPIVEKGSTLVPMRDIFEALGATVVWDEQDQSIRARKAPKEIWLQIGNNTARVGNHSVWLNQPPILDDGSTLVPLRFVSEALGATVVWNGNTRVVRITTDGAVTVLPSHPHGVTYHHAQVTITVPAGVVVPVILDNNLSSVTARVGETFWTTVKSQHAGDSEFPPHTKIKGKVTQVSHKTRDKSGAISVEFNAVEFPDGARLALNGDLISLDENDVRQTSSGRIVAKWKKDNNANSKTVLIGAGAGYVLGHVILGKNGVLSGALGAVGGYLLGKHKGTSTKPQEAKVNAGTELGVRLNNSVSYEDRYSYETERNPYLK